MLSGKIDARRLKPVLPVQYFHCLLYADDGISQIYQTSRGYFVVTPDVQRLVGSATASSPSPVHSLRLGASSRYKKPFLMSTDEAYVKVHGDIETLRDGDQTHQNIQTNLADIISGGEFKPLS